MINFPLIKIEKSLDMNFISIKTWTRNHPIFFYFQGWFPKLFYFQGRYPTLFIFSRKVIRKHELADSKGLQGSHPTLNSR